MDIKFREEAREKWKLIDFSFSSGEEDVYKGFVAGNGQFGYDDDFTSYIFKDSEYSERKMAIAREILTEMQEGRARYSREGRKMAFNDAIHKTHSETLNYIERHNDDLRLDLDIIRDEINNYVDAIKANFEHLKRHITVPIKATAAASTVREAAEEELALKLDHTAVLDSGLPSTIAHSEQLQPLLRQGRPGVKRSRSSGEDENDHNGEDKPATKKPHR